MQPKAVLFDYGNVLCLPQGRTEVEAMAAALGAPLAGFEQAYWKDRLAFDQAAVTPEAYWETIAGGFSRKLPEAEREHLIQLDNRSWANPDPVMVRWAEELRGAGVRTAVLSNMPITLRTHLARVCAWLPEFDYSCYSCDVGLAKPGAEIFLHCLKGVDAAPGEALFLDDRLENIEAARALGIHVIHFTSPDRARSEIKDRYHLPVQIPLGPEIPSALGA